LASWLASGRASTLNDIDRTLFGKLPLGRTTLDRACSDEWLLSRLAEALRQGKLHVHKVKEAQYRDLPPPLKPRPPLPAPEPKPDPERTFVHIKLLDDEGNPVPGVRYSVLLPDGATREGTLNSAGEARVEYVTPGECKVTFPDLEDSEWKPGGPDKATGGT